MQHFVGLDVSMKETAVCVVDETGQRIWEGSVPSTPVAIATVIRVKAPELARVGMETGPQAVWLWHALRELGIAVDCIHARRAAAALKLQANKTDRNDAFGLAAEVVWEFRPVCRQLSFSMVSCQAAAFRFWSRVS